MNRIVYILFFVAVFLASSCGRQVGISRSSGNAEPYDSARFEYYYVEALKQKHMGNPGEALKYFEQCIKINPASDGAYFQIAQVLANTGDLKNARKYAMKASSYDSNNHWYHLLISQLFYQDKNLDSAIIWYEKAVKANPENEEIQLTLGNLYIENSKFDKANSIFDAFDRKYGVNEASTLSSVRSLIASGRLEDALIKAEQLHNQDKSNVNYSGILAEVYRGLGRKAEAGQIYREMMEADPGDPQVQLALAQFLLQEKLYDDLFSLLNTIAVNDKVRREDKLQLYAALLGIPELTKEGDNRLAISLMVLEAGKPDDDIFPILRIDLLTKQGKNEEAVKKLEEIISRKPQNYFAWEKLLLTYLDMGNYTLLTTKGEEASRRFNMSLTTKLLYAQGAIETGRFDTAMEELKKAQIIAGENKDALLQVLTMRADIYYRTKDYDNAFQTFDEALKVNNSDLTVMNNYAYYLAEQGMRLKEAEKLAEKVVRIEKNNTTFLDTYGWVLFKRGRLNEAEKVFESIISKGEKPDAEWFEHYGYVLQKQRKCRKAIETWETALKLDPAKGHLLKEIENCKK